MFSYYCKAKGFDFLGFPCTIYFRTKHTIHNPKILANRLYCEETGHSITHIYAPRIKYFFLYIWHTLRGKNVAPEDWCADPISTISF